MNRICLYRCILSVLFVLPTSLISSTSEPKPYEFVEYVNQLISANKQSIQPIFAAYNYRLDKILEFNDLEKKADDEYLVPKIRKASAELVFISLFDLIENINTKLPHEDKLSRLMSTNEKLSNYFDINIRPSLPQLLSRSTQNKYLSELMHKIKEFENLEKIEIKLPTQKAKLITIDRNIAYPKNSKYLSSQEEWPEGTVELLLFISKVGKVFSTKVLSETDKLLNEAATKGVKSWTFNPTIRDGLLVQTRFKTKVVFRR
jgi:TonB family protein